MQDTNNFKINTIFMTVLNTRHLNKKDTCFYIRLFFLIEEIFVLAQDYKKPIKRYSYQKGIFTLISE